MLASYLEVEKTGSQLFQAPTKTVAAIWRERKVDPCYLETKKGSSQLLGARKKIKTSIYSLNNWFTAIRSMKKMLASYLEEEKSGSQLFRA